MEKAYELAKQGGYEGRLYSKNVNSEWLDPLFWQSLGKALGWKSKFEIMTGLMDEETGETPLSSGKEVEKWEYEWHSFIDHLVQDKPADEFFNELIK